MLSAAATGVNLPALPHTTTKHITFIKKQPDDVGTTTHQPHYVQLLPAIYTDTFKEQPETPYSNDNLNTGSVLLLSRD